MILKAIKEHNLKAKEFAKFCNLSINQFNYAIKQKDNIYLAGLEIEFKKFIKYKINQLKELLND